MHDRPLRCGVVGVGRMGARHARVYAQLPGCVLVGVTDRDAERARAVCAEHGGSPFATPADLLAAGVDAVSIAAPTVHHLEAARPLLEAGVACLIEKPLAADPDEAQAIKALAERGGATLMVGHIERYNPAVQALRRQSGGDIQPRFIEVHRVSPMTFRSVDVGVVLDMMIHDIDVTLMLVGGREPDDVQAASVSVITPHEDVCNARLTWRPRPAENFPGCVANITASRLALKTERKIRIVAADAYVSIDFAAKTGMLIRRTANQAQLADVHARLRAGADLSSLDYSRLVAVEPLAVDDAEPLRLELQDFVRAVRERSAPPIDASAGFANVRTARRIVEAAAALA